MCKHAPYNHLRSIHQCLKMYDHARPWITHCSIQRIDVYRTSENTNEWQQQYGKPVVLDEIAYEGNIQHGWGNISGEEMNRRFWDGALRGGYPGHGETYLHPSDILWWSHGGELHGESWKRAGFLLDFLNSVPGNGLKFAEKNMFDWDCVHSIPAIAPSTQESNYHVYYYEFMRPMFREFIFDDNQEWDVDVIDTWNMSITRYGVCRGKFRVDLGHYRIMQTRGKRAIIEP